MELFLNEMNYPVEFILPMGWKDWMDGHTEKYLTKTLIVIDGPIIMDSTWHIWPPSKHRTKSIFCPKTNYYEATAGELELYKETPMLMYEQERILN